MEGFCSAFIVHLSFQPQWARVCKRCCFLLWAKGCPHPPLTVLACMKSNFWHDFLQSRWAVAQGVQEVDSVFPPSSRRDLGTPWLNTQLVYSVQSALAFKPSSGLWKKPYIRAGLAATAPGWGRGDPVGVSRPHLGAKVGGSGRAVLQQCSRQVLGARSALFPGNLELNRTDRVTPATLELQPGDTSPGVSSPPRSSGPFPQCRTPPTLPCLQHTEPNTSQRSQGPGSCMDWPVPVAEAKFPGVKGVLFT